MHNTNGLQTKQCRVFVRPLFQSQLEAFVDDVKWNACEEQVRRTERQQTHANKLATGDAVT